MILEGGNVTSLQWETEAVLQNHSEPTFLVPSVRILDTAAAHLTGFLAYGMLVVTMSPF